MGAMHTLIPARVFSTAWRFTGGQVGTHMLGNGLQYIGADYAFPYPSWHHVVLTGDATGVVIYIDGQVAASDPGAVSSGSSGFTFNIGGFVFGESAQSLLGEIDDVFVFSRALIQDEIKALMQGTGAYPYAMSPVPADNSMNAENWVTFSWKPGDFAVSHDFYLGDNFDDVNDGLGDTFRANLDVTYYAAGFQGYPYPDGLIPGTTYYWRIDEVNETDPNSPWKGPVWSFLVPSKKAYNASPENGTLFVDTNVTLTWMAGLGTKVHTVFFGDDFDTVNNATEGIPQGLMGYSPGPLEFDKTYYWRVDESDGFNIYKGDVLSFTTTIPGLGEIVMERWENIPGTDVPALTNSSKYPNNPDVTEALTQFSWDQDLEDYGGRIHGWLYAPGTGDFTFWLCADDNGELWLSTDDDSTNVRLVAQESSYSNPNTWGTGEEQSEPIPLVAGNKYYIMALWKEGTGGDQCQVAWQGPGVPTREIIPGNNLSPYEPLNAYGAKPTNAAVGVTQAPVQWKPGLQAISHEVYFGADEETVRNATKASPEYKGIKSLGDESYDPGKLPWESTYYWRVDEVNATNPASPWKGGIWSFTTADFLIIDDFESYDAGDKQIWYSWHDGLGYGLPGVDPYFVGNGTGAAIGDDTTTTYTEQSIVHGGAQSMPYWYNNNKQGYAYYSEAEKKLTESRDWTEQGVMELSLWFRGYPASTGSFVEAPVGTFTMTGSGFDIWFNADNVEADEFHFAYKMLSGAGSMVAKVQSLDNTNDWAKAGVMIRETLDPESAHAFMALTPTQGVSFQRRPGTDAASESDNSATTDEAAPYWVKIDRSISGSFTASHSANGTTWQTLGTPLTISMDANVYVGLAVTSHDTALTCQAVFSNVTTTGNVTGQWSHQDIGITSNAAEPLYVAVSNAAGNPAVVVHDDPAAAQIDTWTEWVIPLQAFADQGINLADVDRISIGLGTKDNITASGGLGKMYFDDIRLYRPREIAE